MNMMISDDSKNRYYDEYETCIKRDIERCTIFKTQTNQNLDMAKLEEKCCELKTQLKRKNELMDDLFDNKDLFVKSWDDLSAFSTNLQSFFENFYDKYNDQNQQVGLVTQLHEDVDFIAKFLSWVSELKLADKENERM